MKKKWLLGLATVLGGWTATAQFHPHILQGRNPEFELLAPRAPSRFLINHHLFPYLILKGNDSSKIFTTNQWDMIEIEFESMYRTAKYQLYETQPFAFDSIVGHQLRTKEIYIKKTNFQSGMVVNDTLTVSLKYKTPDTLFLNF